MVAAVVAGNLFTPDPPRPEASVRAAEFEELAVAPEIEISAESEPVEDLAQPALDGSNKLPSIEPELTFDLVPPEEVEEKEDFFVSSPQRNLDERFAAEPVDTDWAPGIEATIDATLRSNKNFVGFEDIDIECRTTMCRVKVVHHEPLPPPVEGEWGIEAELSMLLRPVIEQNIPRLRASTSYTRYPQSDDEPMITGIYLIPGN